MNEQEWSNPGNWPGPRWLNAYYSPNDTRFWVPKRCPLHAGWTINLAHPRARIWMAMAAVLLCLLPPVIVALLRGTKVLALPGAWSWLGASLALATVAAMFNALIWRRWTWVGVGLTFGIFAAIAGFAIQNLLNGPVVAVLGGVGTLTWRSHIYLALGAALAQSFGKCMFLGLAWFTLRAEARADKVHLGLLVGLGFTIFEIVLLWTLALWAGQPITGWWLGAIERGTASFFHIYSTALLALALTNRRLWLFALVLFVHWGIDWIAGANASLLHLSDVQVEGVLAIPVALMWLIFVAVTRRLRAAGSADGHATY